MLKINAAEVYNFSAMVDYQEGSIVSREIIQKKSGTITVFAFDAGQGLSEHKAPFDALVYILDGSAEIFIDGKMFKVTKGEVIILPLDVIHELKAKEKFKMALIMIR
ncbi:MAG: cupin domain-containing protein [Patescibacteria group bacterium]|jgi:quercetin dioxygenase-like cupin family protein|nr:cupin domain-containing protein [Patescibacteria group bacterium]